MNNQYILFHLREAREQIEQTIAAIQSDPEYDYGDYVVEMSHLYHHVNTDWNARDSNEERVGACSQEDFDKWRKMPGNDDLLLMD